MDGFTWVSRTNYGERTVYGFWVAGQLALLTPCAFEVEFGNN